jgi:hypothetical protein
LRGTVNADYCSFVTPQHHDHHPSIHPSIHLFARNLEDFEYKCKCNLKDFEHKCKLEDFKYKC